MSRWNPTRFKNPVASPGSIFLYREKLVTFAQEFAAFQNGGFLTI